MTKRSQAAQPRQPRAWARGWRGRGAGYASYVEAAPEWRGTSVQVCGLWPFGAGSGTPMVGVPLGQHQTTGAAVCCDPVSWFERAGLISNPSVYIVGRPGLGKSTIGRRMCMGLAAYGVTPLVFGDLKPDYGDMIQAIGGNVVPLRRGVGRLNILDPGTAAKVAQKLSGEAREQLLADATGRRLTMVSALLAVNRQASTTDHEEAILDAALNVLDQRHHGVPILPDLASVLEAGPDQVRAVTLARGDETVYRAAVDPLQRSLNALSRGSMGEIFAGQTSVPVELDQPLSIDISGIPDSDMKLQAAALLACWSEGFASINAHHALADAGLAPQRNFIVVLDELWRVLRSGKGMVQRIDALKRLNRQEGVGQIEITHSLYDALTVTDPAEREQARGLAAKAGFLITGGQPHSEIAALREVWSLSGAEERMITEWNSPPAWNSDKKRRQDPPGLGKFLIKVGDRPGIPIKVNLVPAELDPDQELHNTNKRWAKTLPTARIDGAEVLR